MARRARLVLHLPETADLARPQGFVALYARIAALMRARGAEVLVAGRSPAMLAGGVIAGDGDLHVIENGWARGEGILNGGIAYLDGFWHLDPQGIHADSSIGTRRFDPATVDPRAAAVFLQALRARFVAKRRSRYHQPALSAPVPEGAIAVFLQGPQPYRRGQADLAPAQMLRAVLDAAGDRPVVVKPHPHPRGEAFSEAALAALGGDAARLSVLRGNVHDILARAAVTVSVNSAVAIEGFLHGRPAVLCGRSDFGQFAHRAGSAEGIAPALAAALAQAAAGPCDFAAPLLWYFRQCLQPDAPGFEADLLAILAAAGFPLQRFVAGPG